MTVQLNHTIVHARDKQETARHLAEILGLPEPAAYGPFLVVQVSNEVSLDVADDHGEPHSPHYAFLVSELEFDQIHGRIRERGLQWWADPSHSQPGEINHKDGGRGLYWNDPNGHSLEILTVPYGGWS
jgi:catechol 2,3-dioxygenase-like lactoylglutathione lyase family enzyme